MPYNRKAFGVLPPLWSRAAIKPSAFKTFSNIGPTINIVSSLQLRLYLSLEFMDAKSLSPLRDPGAVNEEAQDSRVFWKRSEGWVREI
jgi:hypothetical protein